MTEREWPQGPILGGEATSGSGLPLNLLNPSTGAVHAAVGTPDWAELDRAVRLAHQAFSDGRWADVPVLERQRTLMRAAQLLRDHDAALARLIAEDMGMPESAARYVEVPMAAAVFEYYAGLVVGFAGETLPVDIPSTPPQYLAYTERVPVGVAALITPFNFPLLIPAWKIAPALASGSAAVLKPAPEAPRVALALAALLEEAGIPPGVVSVLPGSDEVGAALVSHPLVDKVSFTGSTEVGSEVARSAGAALKRVSLELGGKSPALVFSDADLDNAVSQTLFGLMFNSGQVCQAASRILVERPLYTDFVGRYVERARALRLGPATDPATDLGPLVRPERRGLIDRLVGDAARSGARVALGGRSMDGPGYFYPATVLHDLPPGAEVAETELFGPVACIMPFDSEAEAVALANGTRYGLAAAVFTRDVRRAHAVTRRLRAGTVWINTAQVLTPTAPFGGMKASGIGRELGRAGLEAFTEIRTVLVDLSEAPPTYF